MATLPPRTLKIGKIIDKTLGVIELNAVPALIFVLALTAANLPITYASTGSMDPMKIVGGQLLGSLVGIVAGYFLLVAMIRRTGLRSPSDGDAFLPYIGMALLSGIAVMLGLIVIILPGLFLMARWIIAGPLVVARGHGVMQSLSESWERMRGSEVSIIVAALALVLLPLVASIAASFFFEPNNLVGMVVSQIASSVISLLVAAMSVAIYGMMVGGAAEASVFE